MKALVTALALFVGFQAQARSIQVSVDHILPVVQIDGVDQDLVGEVHVDLIERTITVQLFKDICGTYAKPVPGQVTCMAMPILEREFEVPLQKREDSCGSGIYSGKYDARPADGNLTVIQVVDHSTRKCKDIQANRAEVQVLEVTAGFGGPVRKTRVKASTNVPF